MKTLLKGFLGAGLSVALCAGLTPAAAFADDTLSGAEPVVEQVVSDGAETDASTEVATSDEQGPDQTLADQSELSETGTTVESSESLEGATEGEGIDSLAEGLLETQEAADVYAEVTVDPDESNVHLWLRGMGPLAQEVMFAVWSDEGGQNDIQWYRAGMFPDGSWVVRADRNATAGLHIVHAYARINGENQFVAETTFELTAPTAKVSVSEAGNGYYVVDVRDIPLPSGVVEVLVPTWTEANGQDDIVWYKAAPAGDGSWSARIDAGSHNGDEGLYVSHVYVKYGSGVMSSVGACEQGMTCENYIFVTGAIGSGKRQVCIKNPTIGYVHIPTWSDANGQDDVVWYPAGDIGGAIWAATIDCTSLKHAGTVISDVYVGDENAGRITYEVVEDDIIPAEHRAMYYRVQGLNSSTNLLIAADTDRCVVGIYEGSQGNWHPIHYFACSPGAWGSPSRKGIFTVQDKGYAFGTNVYTCYYYTQYSGDFLFHSILYNAGTRIVQDGRLGMHLSHGCIRLAIENAKWIYDNVPRGSRVIVY